MVFLINVFDFLFENKWFSPGSFKSICALQLRLLLVQVYCSPTPRWSPIAPLPWATSAVSAGQGGVGASLKGLMEARQGGRAKAGAKHWWKWVQGPKTKTSTGAWLLLRLRLQRGKRH